MTRPREPLWAATVRAMARTVLGAESATAWLSTPNQSFGGLTPLTLAGDNCGAERVFAELERMRQPHRR